MILLSNTRMNIFEYNYTIRAKPCLLLKITAHIFLNPLLQLANFSFFVHTNFCHFFVGSQALINIDVASITESTTP